MRFEEQLPLQQQHHENQSQNISGEALFDREICTGNQGTPHNLASLQIKVPFNVQNVYPDIFFIRTLCARAICTSAQNAALTSLRSSESLKNGICLKDA
jgi:hypothetical protein